VAIEYRWAEGHYERLTALAGDLIGRQATVIAATSTPAALAAKAATTTIPIVFTAGVDPIAAGLIGSLNRPSGNLTGVNVYLSALWGKRLGLLRELVPNAAVIGMLVNPNFPDAESQAKDVKEAAGIIGQQVHIVNASSDRDIDSAFANLVRLPVGALLVASDAFFVSHRDQISVWDENLKRRLVILTLTKGEHRSRGIGEMLTGLARLRSCLGPFGGPACVFITNDCFAAIYKVGPLPVGAFFYVGKPSPEQTTPAP
jgi:ABC-type uncharacterized transport system substrate-binding protein